jgi:RNA polymerase sigma-70 factor, ECF subfamily
MGRCPYADRRRPDRRREGRPAVVQPAWSSTVEGNQVGELEDLALRVSANDAAAFEAIVSLTHRKLYRLAASLIGDAHEAEDVLQESYIKAFDALTARRFEARSEIATWLHRIVLNRAIDALRARRRSRWRTLWLGEKSASEPAVDPRPRLEARDALRTIERWLEDLPDDQRSALVLKELEGLTVPEIAELLRTSEGAIEQRLVRARQALRKKKQGDDHER